MEITSNLSIEGDYRFETFYVLTGNLVGLIPEKENLYTRIKLLDKETLKISLMKSEHRTARVKHIRGSLKDGIFDIGNNNTIISVLSFIKYWRSQKINGYATKEQLLIFLSKMGTVRIGVFRDIT